MYKLIEIDKKLKENRWLEFYQLKLNHKPLIPFPDWSYEEFKDFTLQDCNSLYSEEERFKRYLVIDSSGTIRGETYYYTANDESENLGLTIMLRIKVLPEFQSDELIKLIFSTLKEYNKANLPVWLHGDNLIYDKWYQKFGGVLKLHIKEHKLLKSEMNATFFRQVSAKNESKFPQFRVEFVQLKDLADDLLKEYIKLWNDSLNDEPLGDYDFKYQISFAPLKADLVEQSIGGRCQNLDYLLFNEKDELIGFSSCYLELGDKKNEAIFVEKGMTGIRRDYRGNNFGLMLSAKLYLKLLEEYRFK